MSALRVLQIGIDAYLPDVRPLHGCAHDVQRMQDWLQSVPELKHQLEFEAQLINEKATRPAIIAALEDIIRKTARVEKPETVLIHYAGHGARSTTNAAFLSIEPDGKDEGLVCYDSRQPGGFDLADKELALLIERLAQTGANVNFIMDCCHSGSITRDADDISGLAVRMTEPAPYKRELGSYLNGEYVDMAAQGRLHVPRPRHLLMAACSQFQKAKESAAGGVFTTALIDVLAATGGKLSCAELFMRVRAATRRYAENQDPQFEAIGGFNGWSGFLGLVENAAPKSYLVLPKGDGWEVECGAVQGLASDPDQPARLELYASGSEKAAGMADVVQLGAQKSVIRPEPGFTLDPAVAWQARITSMPAPPLPVANALPPELSVKLDAELKKDASIGVALAAADAAGRYRLVADAGNIAIWNTQRDAMLCGVPGGGDDWPKELGEQLKTIANWERLGRLANRRPLLDPTLVDFVFTQIMDDGTRADLPAKASIDVSAQQLVRGRIRARNRSEQILYFALVYFSSDFGVYVLDSKSVPAGADWVDMWGTGPNDYMYVEEGANQAEFPFKLIVSTEQTDDFLLSQDPLAIGKIEIKTRNLGNVKPVNRAVSNDWFTHDLRYTLVRRQGAMGPQPVELAGGQIRIHAHQGASGTVSLASARPMTRDVSGSDFWKALGAGGAELVNFAATRGDDATVLEITDIAGADTLSQAPLDISINVPLNPGEAILPLAFDGELVLPVGTMWQEADGSTRLQVHELPDIPDDRRSLGKALKLYMFKTVLKQANVNQLRRVVIKPDGSIDYEDTDLIGHVSRANRILLCIHGIIGDTQSLAQGVASAGLGTGFDLVLAYDYENLGTPIADTAAALKDQLAAIGITANKPITILAHSMGGLVSRAMIELHDGAGLVSHLVMCGTPNGGSPFGRIDAARNLATLMLGLASNFMPALLGWTVPLVSALNFTRKLTPTLEQMNPSSDFLRALNGAPRPAVRYTILAGDIEACTAAGDPLPARLVVKLGQSDLMDTLFGRRSNDIAVSVDSIGSVAGASTGPALACHHLNYFASPAGIAGLKSVDWS